MGKETPRKAKVNITYTPKGQAAKRTADVMAEYEEGFSYTDAATGESDAISLKVCNKDLRWANKWLPKKGDKMVAKIKVFSWDAAGKDRTFSCGKFCCDDLSFSGPTLICNIGGVSVPEGQAFRATQRTYNWEKVTIQEIARKIAKRYGLSLHYDAGKINISSIEQNKQTDCEFLNRLCEDYGLYIKVYFGKIIIYDIDRYESKKAVATYYINDFGDGWSYNTTLTGTYTGATIKYTKGDNDEELTLTVGSGKRMLNITEKVDSLPDAQIKACARVNKENRKAVTMSATIKANLKIVAGVCIKIKGAYNINGKYFVDKVTHKIEADGAYTMDLELHKVQSKIKNVTNSSSIKPTKPSTSSASGGTPAADTGALAVGDKVIVNGPAYYAGNGGRSNNCSGMTMYITEILGSNYKYQYGVAKRKGGTRYGWCAKGSLTKA